MEVGEMVRMNADLSPLFLGTFVPESRITASPTERPGWWRKRQLHKAIDETLARLDALMSPDE